MKIWQYIVLTIGCGLCFSDSIAQSLVFLEYSEELIFDENRLPDAQILRGNVCFRHDSAMMYCDSAYFFDKKNTLHAFGHVHLVQGDSIEGWSDKLYYDGNTKLARMRQNVTLIHQESTTLTTDSLNYDRAHNIAYYFSGGTIKDSINTLLSKRGQYTPDNHQATFHQQVHLTNNKFELIADTLCYNTKTHQADLIGPTEIIYKEETTILSSNGWYNTENEKSMLLDRSQVIHSDGRLLTGDTIFYDKANGYGQVIGNMQSIDSTRQITLHGNQGEMWEHPNHGYVTDSVMMVDWSDSTNYTYVHADTLFTFDIPFYTYNLVKRDSMLVDSVMVAQSPDTIWIDSMYHLLRGVHNVRIYREDLQSVCDSIRYHGKDSVLSLYGNPVCWNDNNQVSADSIHIYFKNGDIDYLHGIGNTIAIKQEGSNEYDQLAGKEMKAFIQNRDVYLIETQGNAETVFYPREEDGTYVGINKTQSSYVKLFLENRQIHHVVFTTATSGVMIPIDDAKDTERKLSSFFWAINERPTKPGDIFLKIPRTNRPSAAAVSAATATDEEGKEDMEADDEYNY